MDDQPFDGIVPSKSGEPMNRKAAAWAIERLRQQAGFKQPITPHSLRHAFVTACLEADVPLRACRSRHGMPIRGRRPDTTGVAELRPARRRQPERVALGRQVRGCGRGDVSCSIHANRLGLVGWTWQLSDGSLNRRTVCPPSTVGGLR